MTATSNKLTTKASIRQRIWNYLEEHDIAVFPRPVHNRIPNFKGAETACDKVVELDIFKKSITIKVNPDKPQEQVRFRILELGKTLLVPTPRLKSGLFNQIVPLKGCGKDHFKICASSQGVKQYSTPIDLESKIKIDLIIIGSVAVSREGYRLGKGEGYADMEYAMMRTMGAIDDSTVIITTVHNCQVIDIPSELIGAHDVTVDYIVTPTTVIECPIHSKPTGILWSLLDSEQLKLIPILNTLREKETIMGKDVTLKDGSEHSSFKTRSPESVKTSSRQPQTLKSRNAQSKRVQSGPLAQRNYTTRTTTDYNVSMNSSSEYKSAQPQKGLSIQSGPSRQLKPKVYVGQIPKQVPVTEFKDVIKQRGIQPSRVLWHGNTGQFCLLQFDTTDGAEYALEAMKGLTIGGSTLSVQLHKDP